MRLLQRQPLLWACPVVCSVVVLLFAGCGSPAPVSSTGPATIINYETSAIPAGLSASVNGLREIKIMWDRPRSGVSKYRVERSKVVSGPFMPLVTVDPHTLQFIDRGKPGDPMHDEVTHFYRVVSILRNGSESQSSTVVRGATGPPPRMPPALVVKAAGSRTVDLKWKAPASAEIVKYRVERASASSPNEFLTIASPSATKYRDGGTVRSDLKDSTEYLYRVIAVNRVDAESPPALAGSVTTPPPPRPVRGLTGLGRQVRCVPLSWQASPEADIVRYDVYRLDPRQEKFVKIGTINSRAKVTYLDGGSNPGNLADNETYSYRVRAVNSVMAESADSDTIKVTTHAVPRQIEGVTAQSGGARQVVVSWPRSKDPATIGYEVWCAPGGGDLAEVGRVAGRDTTRFTYRGDADDPAGIGRLKDAARYAFEIIEFNVGFVRSSPSETAVADTKPLPARPGGLKATTVMPNAITLQWNANHEPDIVHYVVDVSHPQRAFSKLADVPNPGKASILFARETGLDNGLMRLYRVKAVDKDRLESEWSPTVVGKTKPLPGAPSKLVVGQSPGGFSLSWTAPKQTDIREYAIWKKNRFSWDLYSTTHMTKHVFLDDELEKQIVVKVTAIDEDNLQSAHSDTVTVGTKP